MKSLKEQIANKCIHFNGIMNDTCKAGIKYSDVRVDEDDGPYKFPCLKQAGECPHVQFRTAEEIDAYVKSIEDRGNKAMVAVVTVKDHYTKTKEQSGKVPCQCGGYLHYAVASINGHVWAKFNSCGLSFNE